MNRIPNHIREYIPKQHSGNSCETHVTIDSKNDLKNDFDTLCQRLLNINQWEEYASLSGADFILMNSEGIEKNNDPDIGDFVRIRYSKHQNLLSEKFDFVQIEKLIQNTKEEDPFVLLQLRPSVDPSLASKEISHFFDDSATNSFIIYVLNNQLHFSIIGRNECTNKEVERTIDKIRHFVFANLGFVAFSKIQWESFAKGITNLNEEYENE